ncbi:MAG: HlyD family secretion protein [Limnohabitans sp.]
MSQLFRPEALEHAKAKAYGSVLLARPVSHLVLTALFAGFALLLVALFASLSYTRKAKVSGVLLPAGGLIRVAPLQAGQIVNLRVREGQAVLAGEVLFELASERTSQPTGSAEASIAVLLAQRRDSFLADQAQLRLLSTQRLQTLARRVQDLEGERLRVADQVSLQQRRVGLAESALQRQQDLHRAAFVSQVQVQERQAELLDQQQRLADLQRTEAGVARELTATRAEIAELDIQARREQEAGRRSVSSTEQELTENEARRQLLVRAPQDGVITAITAHEGQAVPAGQALASLLPQGAALEAELYAPSRAAGFLKPGMSVNLRYQAYAYQKFGQATGRVREVSSTAMRPEELAMPSASVAPGQGLEPMYRVRVTLPRQTVEAFGSDVPLRSGAVLDASVLLEKRRLYEWVLEPLYTIKGRV